MMSVDLNVECQTEKKIINIVKIEAIKKINKLGFEGAANKLGLSATGLRRLVFEEWNVTTVIRVAEALNLSIIKKLARIVDKTDAKPGDEDGDYPDWEI